MTEETLFLEALSRPPEVRAAFLAQACAGQPELLAAVEALLAAHDKPSNLLDRPPAGLGQTVDSDMGQSRGPATGPYIPEPEDPPPQLAATTDHRPRIEPGVVIAGRYTLQQKIGEGGMGEVWIARQTEPVKRQVALKLIKTGMDSGAVLTRFEQERQALALMDHPNIARVLDGGVVGQAVSLPSDPRPAGSLPHGQPFFVMELVNGLPLTRFCDEARLTPKERLELFVPICQAVQHAHQKGIVHRDLKPANILVTRIDGRPVPKVIDFGVAKATAGKLIDESLSTQFGAVIGTFEYMAPEQAGITGADIDTRADVYSLGVILYELLTGLRPLDARRLRKAALTEMIRIIREEEPSKPSTRLSLDKSLASVAALRQTEPRRLMAMLRGELDWVVMRCLEKQRDRRYETANALSRDIQRYLADEAVEARPPSAGYRLRKFLRRNQGLVLAASLVLLALVGGIIGTTFGMLHAEQRRVEADEAGLGEARQRMKAEQARDRTRQALNAMTSSVTGDSLTTQKVISEEQKKFLREVLTYYQEFAGENADDESSRAYTALAAYRVGHIEYRLGRKAEAATAIRLARDRYEKLAADFPTVPLYRQNLAINHNNLGILLKNLGKEREAEQQYRRALDLQEELAADYTARPVYRDELAATHQNLGILLADLGKRPEAEQQYRAALDLQEKLTADFPEVPEYRQELARSHGNLGNLLRDLGKGPEAEQQYRRALDHRVKLAAEFPTITEYRQDLANGHNGLGLVLSDLEKRLEAEQQYRRALVIQEKLAAEYPAVPEYRQELAISHHNLGLVLNHLGKQLEAEQQYRAALALREKLVATFPTVPEYRHELARNHHNLGGVLTDLGKRPEAEQQYRAALVLLKKLAPEFPAVPAYSQVLAASHHGLGNLLKGLGKGSEAEQHYRQSLAIQEKLAADFPSVPQYQIDLGGSSCNFGIFVEASGRPSDSLVWFDKAIRALTAVHQQNPQLEMARQFLRNSHLARARTYEPLQKFAEAVKDLDRTIELSPKKEQPDYQIALGGCCCNFGNSLRAGGRPSDSLVWFDKAIHTLTVVHKQDPQLERAKQFLRNSHAGRAVAYESLQKYAEAVKDWDQAIELSPKADQPRYRVAQAGDQYRLGLLLASLGKRPEAEQQYRAALALYEKVVAEFPAVPQYQIDLAAISNNIGQLIRESGKPGDSLVWFDKAIRTLTPVYERDRSLVLAKQILRNSHWGKAWVYDRLQKFAEAVKDWDRVVELSPEAEQPGYRVARATARTNAGQVVEAVAEVAELTKTPNWNAGQWYDFACVYAVASGKIADKKQQYADRAMELLQRAVKAGYNDAAHMKVDTDLDPLRGRDDFLKLLAMLEKKTAAKREKQP